MTKKQKRVLVRIIASAVLLILFSVLGRFTKLPKIAELCLYCIPYLIIGYDILIKAVKGIWNRQMFDENFLMAVATVGAVMLGEFQEAAAVMLFYQIGELFQGIAVGKSRRNISALMDIRPDYANVELDGEVVTVDPDEVEIGSIIVIKAGEKIPIDGVIIDGHTTINTAALTGESLPVDAEEGSEIKSGCINMTGVIRVRTTKEFGESTVSKILELVENSSAKKSRSENFISKFARVYTPAVCGCALALAVIAPVAAMLIGTEPHWGEWIMRALTFLVISCPCALVISIPLSFFAGIGGASSEGILIKGSNYIETLSKTKYAVFDKTGTMTKGIFEVSDIYAKTMTEAELIEYAALAESGSNHPIAKSIQSACKSELDMSRISEITEVAGKGVNAVIDGKRVLVGNGRLMDSAGVEYTEKEIAGTAVYIAADGVLAGTIIISDVIKPNSAAAIKSLKSMGVLKTVMLTGDTEASAKATAAEIGVDEYYSALMPEDKVKKTEELIERKRITDKLAFIGDGINDAPVLSRADVGIAMGGLGSDAAIEAADVVLMDDDPLKISRAIKISQKCMRIVYQNIIFAIGIKFICLALGALGLANMWLAIFADVGVMVIAVLNAIRAMRCR